MKGHSLKPHIFFFPGAIGAAEFWYPLGRRISRWANCAYLSWPGLGREPHIPGLSGYVDLAGLARPYLEQSTLIVAQSMGAIPALRLALDYPESVAGLVLVAPTGGCSVAYSGQDWRGEYVKQFPSAAGWSVTGRPELDGELASLQCPVLVVSGGDDPLSPPPLGAGVARLMARSEHVVIPVGTHDLARELPARLASLIMAFAERSLAW